MVDRDLHNLHIIAVLSIFTFKKQTVKTDPKLFLSEKPWVSAAPKNRVIAVVRRKPLPRSSRVIHASCH